MSTPNARADYLAVVATAPLMTGRYSSWRPTDGVPVGITVGRPKFWRHAEQPIEVKLLAPFGLLGKNLTDDEAAARYRQRLDDRSDSIVATLARLARQHADRPLVMLCFEDVHAGQICHRRWLADWFTDRHGLVVDEVPAATPDGPPRLF